MGIALLIITLVALLGWAYWHFSDYISQSIGWHWRFHAAAILWWDHGFLWVPARDYAAHLFWEGHDGESTPSWKYITPREAVEDSVASDEENWV